LWYQLIPIHSRKFIKICAWASITNCLHVLSFDNLIRRLLWTNSFIHVFVHNLCTDMKLIPKNAHYKVEVECRMMWFACVHEAYLKLVLTRHLYLHSKWTNEFWFFTKNILWWSNFQTNVRKKLYPFTKYFVSANEPQDDHIMILTRVFFTWTQYLDFISILVLFCLNIELC
jgi:hypothetical protein